MGLYERLMWFEEPRISSHQLFGCMQEIALGNMTGPQGVTNLVLSPAEATEASTLQAVIAAQPTADARKLKAIEFERVGMVAEQRLAPYMTVAAVKARFGV